MGVPDPTPTLVELEKTHILFVNAHFKPFAAIAYEYQKTKPNTGVKGLSEGRASSNICKKHMLVFARF